MPDDLRSRDFRKILLIKLSAVGDVVHTFPVLNKLKRRYPAARLDWLVAAPIAELLQHNPAISNVIEFARDERSAPWRLAPFVAAARLVAQLRAVEYDLVIDLQGQLRSGFFAFTSGAPVRIGFDKPRADIWKTLSRKIPDEARKHAWQGAREGSWLAYTDHIALPTLDIHPVERYLGIGAMLGLDDGPADFSFPIPPEARARIDALVDYYEIAKAKLLVMAPGTNWETKEWRREAFAEVARHFMKNGFAVTLIGSERERALCDDVAKLAPGAINLAGETTLSELAALSLPRDDLRHQRFRADASRRRARPPRRQHFRPDRSGLGRTVPARRRGAARRPAVLAVLSAAAQPLPEQSRLHEECLGGGRDRTRRKRPQRTRQ